MGRRAAALFGRSAVFLLAVLASGQMTVIVSAQVPTIVVSSWMTQPIIVDGKITKAEEWSDTIAVDLTLSNNLKPASLASFRVWIKNDRSWLFILASVRWPAKDIDGRDSFAFTVASGSFRTNGTIMDQSSVYFDGRTEDGLGVVRPGKPWEYYDDTKMSPPGRNDVKGAACHNGTHYWFELGKPLNTGDPYDLALALGQVYPNALFYFCDRSGSTSEERNYGLEIMLRVAPVLPSIEFVRPEDQAATRASEVRFVASVLGHLSKVTLVMGGEDHEMRLNQAGLYEASLTLADGIYKWRVNALGVLGNVTSMPERTLAVDTTKPVVTIRSPTMGEVIRKSEVLVSWEALDTTSGIAKVEVKIGTSDWIDVTGKTSYSATWIVEGNNEVRMRVTDKAGNVAENAVTFTFLPPPWYVTYWYVPLILAAVIVVIVAVAISRRGPAKLLAKPPEVKPLKIEPSARPPTREQLLKELEELYRSGRITETAYRRLKKKYETETS